MIISNIGTIILSLPSGSPTAHALVDAPSTALMSATQVRMLSIANTLSRFLVGFLADMVSPVPSCTIDGSRGSLRKHRVSRIAFLAFATALLVCTYFWMVVGVREQVGIWVLRSVSSPLAIQQYLITHVSICPAQHRCRRRVWKRVHHPVCCPSFSALPWHHSHSQSAFAQPISRLLHLGPHQSRPQLRHPHVRSFPRHPNLFVPLCLHL